MIAVKRGFDIFWAVLGLLTFVPLFAVIAVLIKIMDGGPVFFRQKRVGYKGRLFSIWKFRTMVRDAENRGSQITVGRDSRITKIGYWLRKTKLDELPQLINVLLGEMTLVGPRPEVPRYVAMYTTDQCRVLDLVPGIVDPASIKYCNESELLASSHDPEFLYINELMPEKIRLNLAYAEKATICSDTWVISSAFFYIIIGVFRISEHNDSSF